MDIVVAHEKVIEFATEKIGRIQSENLFKRIKRRKAKIVLDNLRKVEDSIKEKLCN